MPKLTFSKLRKKNLKRCNESFHRLDTWSPSDYGCALAGEVGEACNLIKKMRRGDQDPDFKNKIAKELADVQTYLDLLAACLDIDLENAVVEKFNEVSDRVNSPVRL